MGPCSNRTGVHVRRGRGPVASVYETPARRWLPASQEGTLPAPSSGTADSRAAGRSAGAVHPPAQCVLPRDGSQSPPVLRSQLSKLLEPDPEVAGCQSPPFALRLCQCLPGVMGCRGCRGDVRGLPSVEWRVVGRRRSSCSSCPEPSLPSRRVSFLCLEMDLMGK